MADARPEKPYTFDIVAGRLSQAGMTLLALHVAGCRPSGYRSFWPDVAGAVADDRTEGAPTPRDISDMDEALG